MVFLNWIHFPSRKINIENDMKKKDVAKSKLPWGLGLQKSLPVFPGGFRMTRTWESRNKGVDSKRKMKYQRQIISKKKQRENML